MKILIAYDGSASADAIFEDLNQSGFPRDTEALVVSVADLIMSNPPIREVAAQAFTSRRVAAGLKQARTHAEQVIKEAEDFAAHAADRLRRQFPKWAVRSETEVGAPAWKIMEAAKRFNADVIVVGSEGRSMVGRLFLGSVSKKIAEDADCSVRLARRIEAREEIAPPRIIIGVNDSPTAVQAILSLGRRVWHDKTEVKLIAVDETALSVRITDRLPQIAELIESYQQPVKSRIQDFLEWGAKELKFIGIKAAISVEKGDPRKILVSEAKNWNADCIFVGTRSLDNFLERFRLGSVSTAVATNAHCSVEVVRPPDKRHE